MSGKALAGPPGRVAPSADDGARTAHTPVEPGRLSAGGSDAARPTGAEVGGGQARRRPAAGAARGVLTALRPRVGALVVLVFALLGGPLLSEESVFPYLVLAGILGTATLGVGLLAGLGGQVTLGQGALVGAGAYTAGLLTTEMDLDPVWAALLAIVAGVVIALPASVLLRLQGWYLAVATLGLVYIFGDVLKNWKDVTGGVDGVYGIPPLEVGDLSSYQPEDMFQMAWLVVAVVLLLAVNIQQSRYGRAMGAIHKDEEAARSVGIAVFRYKVYLWLLAGGLAGLSGALFAHYSAFIAPDNFGLNLSFLLITAVFLAGERRLLGALVALVVLTATPVLPLLDGVSTEMLTGVALIAVYLLSGTGEPVRRWVARAARRRPSHA